MPDPIPVAVAGPGEPRADEQDPGPPPVGWRQRERAHQGYVSGPDPDLVVLDRDYLTVPVDQIKDIVSVATEFAQQTAEPDPSELWTDVLVDA